MKPINIHKNGKRKYGNFFQADNSILTNTTLSMQAKFVLVYLLSKPPTWNVVMVDIVNSSTNGEYSVRSAVKELIKAGHMTKTVERDESGKYRKTVYHVYETPVDVE